MKSLTLISAVASTLGLAHAGTSITPTTLDLTWIGSLAIPDNNGTGASRTLNFNAPSFSEIQAITVEVAFDGGWNGDLYAYLVHDGTLAILLNRPGRTASNDFGFASTSLVARFMDTAAADVHTGLPDTGTATGSWQPDGRYIDPLLSLDTTPRTRMLDGFTGTDPNGDWTLFVADQGAGETTTLTGFTLSITAIPEPSVAMLGGMVALLALRRRRPLMKGMSPCTGQQH